jgi:hypothetical protein
MSPFAIMLILFSLDRPAPVPAAPRVPVSRNWPYK